MDDKEKQLEQMNEFVRLLLRHQDQIQAYLTFLMPIQSDKEDLMQDVIHIMLKKFDAFEPGSNFAAWGKKIARYRVFEYIRQHRKMPFVFSEETLEAISNHVEPKSEEINQRLDALNHCLKKLPERDQQLIVMRYERGTSTKVLAQRLDVSLSSVYRSIYQIQDALKRCIKRILTANQ